MKIIKNPNDIVTELVNDYQRVFGDFLLSIVMYGSAVTHEYQPGISDVNIIVVLKDNALSRIKKCLPIAHKWHKRKVDIPFFMTQQFITSALDSYPVEFLDIQNNHRILFGEDFFSRLAIDRENLRLQCERELRGISIHIRKEFVKNSGNASVLARLSTASMKKLLPVFKALLRLNNKPAPKIQSDVIMAIEDLYHLDASTLSGMLNLNRQGTPRKNYHDLFEHYVASIDRLIGLVDTQ